MYGISHGSDDKDKIVGMLRLYNNKRTVYNVIKNFKINFMTVYFINL